MREKSLFEIVHENLRSAIRYLHFKLGLSIEGIRSQVNGILHSLEVETLEKKNRDPERPA